MCTVTVVRAGGPLRVACNRDERRDRVTAHPPFITRAGGLHVLTPQDPQGRGTWIAANSAGLIFALLNVNGVAASSAAPSRSRGLVIPSLADASAMQEVVLRLEGAPARHFAPFRLLVADAFHVAEFIRAADAETVEIVQIHRVDAALLFTSSSLGDAIVEGPRRLLFEQMFQPPPGDFSEIAARQDAFHAHRWRDRPAVSVHMSRPDACTVSTTVVEVTGRDVRMVYEPAHCAAGTPVGLVIERQHAGHTSPARIGREHAAV
jgi:hypothetical protein